MSDTPSGSRPSRGLPQELVDGIVDHLQHDKETLKNCSLVCQAWVPRSSLHLLRCISWPPSVHVKCNYPDLTGSTDEQTCPCHSRSDLSFSGLFEAFKTESTRMRYVHELKLLSHRSVCLRRPEYQRGRETLPIRTLTAILDRLPALDKLHIERCTLHIDTASQRAAGYGPVPALVTARYTLRQLIIHDIKGNAALEALALFLSRFTRIGSLIITGMQVRAWPHAHPFAFPVPLARGFALESLHIEHHVPDSAGPEEFMRVLCSELCARANLAALTALSADALAPELLELARAAPELAKITYLGANTVPPLDVAPPPLRVWHVALVVPLHVRATPRPEARRAPAAKLAAHIRGLAALTPAELTVAIHLRVAPRQPVDAQFDVDAAAQNAIRNLERAWIGVGHALVDYTSLERITIEIKNYLPVHDHCNQVYSALFWDLTLQDWRERFVGIVDIISRKGSDEEIPRIFS